LRRRIGQCTKLAFLGDLTCSQYQSGFFENSSHKPENLN
jgi:hypothetical protein